MLLTWDGLDVRYEDPATWRTAGDEVFDDEPEGGIFTRVRRRAELARDMTYVWTGTQDGGVQDAADRDETVDIDNDFFSFRLNLVNHFDYHWNRNELTWFKF
jgi:hypothetical protein